MTEVTAMQAKSNDLHIRVTYATDCPEWWRIQVRRRLGRQGLATRAECIAWLRRYGESEDDNLALAHEQWEKAAAEGEEVRWYDDQDDPSPSVHDDPSWSSESARRFGG